MQLPEMPLFPRVSAWVRAVAGAVDYEFDPLHVFALVGILVVLYLAERAVDFVFFHFATPWKPLTAYRRRGPKPTYALVTGAGAGAGIGLGIAKALARQGFGVVLLGTGADELAAAAAEVRAALVLPEDADPATVPPGEYVKTVVLDAAAATPDAMESALRAAVVEPGLRVSILVNSIDDGGGGRLAACAPADIDDTIAAHARFPARLTALMLPVLTHRGAGVDGHGMSFGTHRRSLVLNVGSAAMVGVPYQVLYGATKGFAYCFSRGLARELEMDPKTSHIDVLGVVPGDVKTQGDSMVVGRTTPDSDTFGRYVVDKTDGAIGRGWREMRPHWFHHLQHVWQGVLSERALTRGLQDLATLKRATIGELQPAEPKGE